MPFQLLLPVSGHLSRAFTKACLLCAAPTGTYWVLHPGFPKIICYRQLIALKVVCQSSNRWFFLCLMFCFSHSPVGVVLLDLTIMDDWALKMNDLSILLESVLFTSLKLSIFKGTLIQRRLWSNEGMFQAFALVWQTAQNGCLHKTGGTNYQSCMYPMSSAWPTFMMPFLPFYWYPSIFIKGSLVPPTKACLFHATPAGTYQVQSPGFPKIVYSWLCCTHFSYHWCKICNVSRWWMQITKRQHDP